MLSRSALQYLMTLGGTANFLSVAQNLHHATVFLIRRGVLEHLAQGPTSLAQLAATIAVRPDALAVLLDAVSHFDIVVRSDDSFALGEEGKVLLAREKNQARSAALVASHIPLASLRMEEILRTGISGVELAYGAPLYSYAARDPQRNRELADLCENFFAACDLSSAAAAYIAQRGHRVIADLGGGHGLLIREILSLAPSYQGILFDLPAVVALHRERLADVPRLTLIEGDFFQSVPSADAYILANVMFNWNDERARSLLANIRAAMGSGGTMYVLDLFQDGSFESAFLNLDELVTTGGTCRTRDAAFELLRQCGYSVTEVLRGDGPFLLLSCSV